jgi:hypothetical protein
MYGRFKLAQYSYLMIICYYLVVTETTCKVQHSAMAALVVFGKHKHSKHPRKQCF